MQPAESYDPADKPECRRIIDEIYAYLDGELDATERRRLQRHLEECPPCVDEYERDALLKELLRRSCACEPAPSTLRSQIMTHITRWGDGSVEYTRVEVRRHEL